VLILFEGEKTSLFWAGLNILGLASWILFASIWTIVRALLSMYFFYGDIENNLPASVGSVVFILIGLYMMKSGVKKDQPL